MPGGGRWLSQRGRTRGAWFGVMIATLAVALAVSGCAGSGRSSAPHASLDASLGSQSVYVTVSLDQQVQSRGMTLALNAQTGALRWKTTTAGSFGTAAVAGGAVYIAPDDGSIRSLDATTGKQNWRFDRRVGVGRQYGFDGYPVVSGGALFVTSDSGAVFALDAATGKPRWTMTWSQTGAGDTIYAAPAVDRGMVFVALGGPEGGAYALSATTGAILWQTSHVLGFDARPVVADGAVYFPAQTPGTLVALDETTGAMRWQQGSSGTNSGPVVGGGLVYTAGADETVRAYHAQDGTPGWTFQTGGSAGSALIPTGAALTLDSGTLYAGSQGGQLAALDAATGKARWTVTINSPIDSPPAVAGGAVFVATESGKVYAYRASDGAPAWTYDGGRDANITCGPVVAL